MKNIIIATFLLFLSMKVFALDANFNSSTGIVSSPRVTVNNQQSFSNLNLLLRPDLTWSILSLDPEIPANLEEGNPNYDSSTSIVTFS